jgi:hypothetical protein
MAGKKMYISSHMYYTVHDTSLQYAVTYNTLQVELVYPTNNRYLGILRLRGGEGRGGMNIIFQVFMLIFSV